MNRFYVFLLSILACLTPTIYSADKKLGMAELCAKVASLQTPLDEAQEATRELVKRGSSLCECFTDYILAARKQEISEQLEEVGLCSTMLDKPIIRDENPGIVCSASMSPERCAYVKTLMQDFFPENVRLIVINDEIVGNFYAACIGGAYVKHQFQKIVDHVAKTGKMEGFKKLLAWPASVQREHGLFDYSWVKDEDRFLMLANRFFEDDASDSARRGTLRHELTHVVYGDIHMQFRRRDGELELACRSFAEDRADIVPLVCGDMNAADDMLAMAYDFMNWTTIDPNDKEHAPVAVRVKRAERLHALRQAEEEFKHAYTECANATRKAV